MRSALGVLASQVLVLAATAAGVTGQSQTTSTLRGTVLTADGAPLSHVTVMVTRPATGAEYAAITNQAGRFIVLLAPMRHRDAGEELPAREDLHER